MTVTTIDEMAKLIRDSVDDGIAVAEFAEDYLPLTGWVALTDRLAAEGWRVRLHAFCNERERQQVVFIGVPPDAGGDS